MKSWRTSETFDRNPPPRIFVFARKQRVVPLSDKFGFVRQRFSLCEARVAPESRPFFKPYMDMNRKPTDKTDKKPRTPSYKYLSGLMKSRTSAFASCSAKPDWSITGVVLLLKESSARSPSLLDATRRRRSSSPDLTTFISSFSASATTVRPSRRYNKYSDGKLLGKCSLKITHHQPTYLKGKPDRECSMSG